MSTTNRLIGILKKEDRSADDIQFLKVYLSKNKFFQQVFESFKASPEINNELCRAIKYETYPKYCVIFKQGDTNCDKAYIILKGRIMIFMKNTIDVFQKDTDKNQHPLDQSLSTKKWQVEGLLEKQTPNDEALRNEVPEQDFLTVLGMEYGKLIIEVEEGALFGEKALIENKPRAATICSKTPCEFLILNKEDFEIVQIKYNKAQQDKKDFIMYKFPFLGNLITSARVFERIVRFFEEESYHKNQILVTEGKDLIPENQKLYIIVSGEVQLYRNVIKKVMNPHSLIERQVEAIHIATLGQSEIFGEELLENDNENKKYVNSAVCVSPNSQFLTLTISVLERKMPDQMKEFIQASYLTKKNLRNTILLEHEKQQKNIETMKREQMNDIYDIEKCLLQKLQSLEKQKDQEQFNLQVNHQERLSEGEYFIEEDDVSILNMNQRDHNFLPQKQQNKKVDLLSNFYKNFGERSKISKQYDLILANQQTQKKNHNSSIDSDDLLVTQEDKRQVIKGNSNQQNNFLLHQLRTDLNEKIKKEGGFKKDMNINYFYENGMQEQEQQQFKKNKCNPYPFKLIANHKHLKQLETRLQQKKFQFADAQEILSKTQYYQAKEKNEITLKQMIEEGQTKSRFYEDPIKEKDKSQLEMPKSSSRLSLAQILKKSPSPNKQDRMEKTLQNQEGGLQFITKKIGITNLFKDKISASEYGYKVENTGRNLFACSGKIKLHSVLQKVSQNYVPHGDYYEDIEEIAPVLEMSKNNSEQQFKYYQMCNNNKSVVEKRRVLSRSPIIRKFNIAKQSSEHGGGVSIPSNKRYLVDNDHNVNSNYYYFKTSVRPSSDEGRYTTRVDEKKRLKNDNINQIETLVMQNSTQSLSNTQQNSTNYPIKNQNNKISVKNMHFNQQRKALDNKKQLNKQICEDSMRSSQSGKRLHSNSNSRIQEPQMSQYSQRELNNSSKTLQKHNKSEFSISNQAQLASKSQDEDLNLQLSKQDGNDSSLISQKELKQSSFSLSQKKVSNTSNVSSSPLNQIQQSSKELNVSKNNQINKKNLLDSSDLNIESEQDHLSKSKKSDLDSSRGSSFHSSKLVKIITKSGDNNKSKSDMDGSENSESREINQKPVDVDDLNYLKKIVTRQSFKQAVSNTEINNQIEEENSKISHVDNPQSELIQHHNLIQSPQTSNQVIVSQTIVEDKTDNQDQNPHNNQNSQGKQNQEEEDKDEKQQIHDGSSQEIKESGNESENVSLLQGSLVKSKTLKIKDSSVNSSKHMKKSKKKKPIKSNPKKKSEKKIQKETSGSKNEIDQQIELENSNSKSSTEI